MRKCACGKEAIPKRSKCRKCFNDTRKSPSTRPTSPTITVTSFVTDQWGDISEAADLGLEIPSELTPPAWNGIPEHDKLTKILFFPDAHIPYHDEKAWNLMIKAGKQFKPDIICGLGDTADFYAVSSHSKNPERRADLEYEIGMVKERLRDFDSISARRKIYIAGNHEDRLYRYLCDRAPNLFGMVAIPEVLDLHRTGWEYVPYKQSIKIGHLNVTHDVGTAGQNAHRQANGAFQGSVLIGHTHRLEYSVMGNANGPPMLAAMLGWLGDFDKVDYMHLVKAKRDWAHGFGIGYIDAKGVVWLVPIPIVNYRCVVEGVMIK